MKVLRNNRKIVGLMLVMMLVVASFAGCSSDDSDEVLRVGMELKWPPFETLDTSGNPDGISVMLAEELGEYLGREVEIVDMQFSALITALETDKVDIILASMSITEERQQKINFTEPYM